MAAIASFSTGYPGLGIFMLVIGGSIFLLGLYIAWLVAYGLRFKVDLGVLPIALIFLGIVIMVIPPLSPSPLITEKWWFLGVPLIILMEVVLLGSLWAYQKRREEIERAAKKEVKT